MMPPPIRWRKSTLFVRTVDDIGDIHKVPFEMEAGARITDWRDFAMKLSNKYHMLKKLKVTSYIIANQMKSSFNQV